MPEDAEPSEWWQLLDWGAAENVLSPSANDVAAKSVEGPSSKEAIRTPVGVGNDAGPTFIGGPSKRRRRNKRRLAVALGGIAMLAAAASVAFMRQSPPPRSAPPTSAGALRAAARPIALLNEQIARRAFDSVFPPLLEELAAGDVRGASHELSLPALRVVAADYFCGCGDPWSSRYGSVVLTAPTESTYPVSFLAQATTTSSLGRPDTVLLVFEKISAGQPWIITQVTNWLGTGGWLLSTPGGMSQPEADPVLVANLRKELAALALMFQQARASGTVASSNFWYPLVHQLNMNPGAEVAELESHYKSDMQTPGMRLSVVDSVSDISIGFSTVRGPTICGDIVGTIVETAPAIVQDARRLNYGPFVTPGDHRSITEYANTDVCLAFTSRHIRLLGLQGGEWIAFASTPPPSPLV